MKKAYLAGLALMLGSSVAVAELPVRDPATVCPYLEQEGLMAGEWKVTGPTEGFCQSSIKYTDKVRQIDPVYYIARGDAQQAHILSVVANITGDNAHSAPILFLRQAAHTLSKRVTGKRLPGNISESIGSQKGGATATVEGVNVRVVRTERADGGFDMAVHFE